MKSPKQQPGKKVPPQEFTTRPPMERMMRIHAEIQTGKYPSAPFLARLLEVKNDKTIRRDIAFMTNRLKLPIDYDPSRKGYYYTRPVHSFPTIEITEGELFSLIVAEKSLRQLRGTSLEKPFRAAIGKIMKSLPENVSFSMADWDGAVSFHHGAEVVFDSKILLALVTAAVNRRQLKILYRKPGEKAHERLIDPYHVACINGEWYVFAYDNDRQDLRTFVPVRIQKMEETGVTFPKPENFSLADRLQGSFGVHSGKGEIVVVVQFTGKVADIIRERRWPGQQGMKDLDCGGVELTLKLTSLPEVQRWVLSYGGDARVIQPPELQRAVFCEAQRIVSAGAKGS